MTGRTDERETYPEAEVAQELGLEPDFLENKDFISGEYTNALVMTDQYDENCEEQIREMVNHPAFENPVRIMPDTHWGSGAVIGFTMPYDSRICPNTVGVDIGCGMYAINLGDELPMDSDERDKAIRDAVPMGRSVHSGGHYHVKNDFPWDDVNAKFDRFNAMLDRDIDFDGYDIDYFKDLCWRVGYDLNRAISSVGTLGGGNHFVEFNRSEATGDYWCVIHSGSRGLGLSIAKYWQEVATEKTTTRKNIDDVPEQYREYLQPNWKPDAEKIREDFDGREIGSMFDKMSQIIQEYGPNADGRNTDLDFLEGAEADGYLIDMLFAQTYASENRKEMARLVAETLDVAPVDEIESVHNYIDFDDGIIRKGATPAREGERAIIPFNMAEGTLLVEGKGNPEWNYSAPHGAGRRMSRTAAFEDLSVEEFQARMDGIETFNDPEEILDEAPMSYKDTAIIESVIEETAAIKDRWTPVHNLKAEE